MFFGILVFFLDFIISSAEDILSIHSNDGIDSNDETPDSLTVFHPSFDESLINNRSLWPNHAKNDPVWKYGIRNNLVKPNYL